MQTFMDPLRELNEFTEAESRLKMKQTPLQLTGCIDTQKSHVIYGLGLSYRNKIIITHSETKAKEICEDFRLYDKNVYYYPAKDVIFYNADVHGHAVVSQRMQILKRVFEKEPLTVVMTLDGAMDYLLDPKLYLDSRVILTEGGTIDLTQLSHQLVNLGYTNTTQVEQEGEFSVRGGILDIFPLTEETPYRIELWGDEVDTIRSFDAQSQRSIEKVTTLTIYPATEVFMDSARAAKGIKKLEQEKDKQVKVLRDQMLTEEAYRVGQMVEQFKENFESISGMLGLESYIRYFYSHVYSILDYFSEEDTLCVLDEPNRSEEHAQAVELEFRESMSGRLEKGYLLPSQSDVLFQTTEIMAKLRKKTLLMISTMDYKPKSIVAAGKLAFTVQSVQSYNNNFDILIKDIERWKQKKYRILLVSASGTRARRMSEDLQGYGLNAFYSEDWQRVLKPGEIMVTGGHLARGFEYPLIQFVMISEGDIFTGEKKKKKRARKATYEGSKVQSFTDLNVGDFVVHENHGLGIYRGIEKIEVEKVTKDYLKIEYAGDGVLYIPATALELLQKYSGPDPSGRKPKLNKLNSVEWKNTKTRVKTAVKEIAKDLVELYAKRQERQGHQYSADTVWQREFEEMFPYEETDDQLMAIEATKKDMESQKIMDRLICGDVGYGKTEIAIRAAFKAVSDGRQVAILVPTTILAQQHYNTFVQRMMDFPISVDMLCRFRTSAEQKKAISRLKKGSLDIVIGTHRLLSKDVMFKNLGLLIVDEEQRFGVTHKEKIKQLKENIDVLTLSATPIPRTLHMSLVGIRDMSVLEEPPVDRMPIQTFVLEHNDELIREAINRELARGGQVYYVHNRVNNIDQVATTVAGLVPEANVAFAHGQMKERELEQIMFDFINGNIDVLVSTTIIETGLDISNVNTMIIDEADQLGLSQLYQLRGRVGRSNRTAYAFLMYRRNKMLKEIAEKRLQAIKEFTDLGSGFKIAMRDLEIRGAGNLLGAQQHGHMEAVGYDMYCKMLNDAVKALKGETVEEEGFETAVEMELDAYIPSSYIKSEFQKLDMYKRISEIENEEEYLDMQEELIDRYGEFPQAVDNLLNIALLKATAHRAEVTQIVYKAGAVKVYLYPKASIHVDEIPGLLALYKGVMRFVPESAPYFYYAPKELAAKRVDEYFLFEKLKQLMKDLQGIEDSKTTDKGETI